MNLTHQEEAAPTITTSKLAVASLVCGIIGPLIMLSLLFNNVNIDTTPPFTIIEVVINTLIIVSIILSISALVSAIIALKRLSKSSNLKGRAFAIIGLILGSLYLLAHILIFILIFMTTRHM